MKSVSVSVKLDRSIKAEQAIGLETSCTGLETNWKKEKDFVAATTKPCGNIPYRNAQNNKFILRHFYRKFNQNLCFPFLSTLTTE